MGRNPATSRREGDVRIGHRGTDRDPAKQVVKARIAKQLKDLFEA